MKHNYDKAFKMIANIPNLNSTFQGMSLVKPAVNIYII
jgi:hypothetical protein